MEGMQPAPEPGIFACDEETLPRKTMETAAPDAVLRVSSPGRRRKFADHRGSEPERVVTSPRASTSVKWSKTGPCKWSHSPGFDKENSGGNIANASPTKPFLQKSQTTEIEKLFKNGMNQMKSQIDALGAKEARLSGKEVLLSGKEAQLSGKEAELEEKIVQLRQEEERLHQEKQSIREEKMHLDQQEAQLATERQEMIFLESQYRSLKERTEAEGRLKDEELEKRQSEIHIEAEKLQKLKSELQAKQEALDNRSKDLEDYGALLEQNREELANRKSMQDQKEVHLAAQEAVLEEVSQSMAELKAGLEEDFSDAAKRASHLEEEEKRLAKREQLLEEVEARFAAEGSLTQQNQEACEQQDRLLRRLLHCPRCLFQKVVQSLRAKHGLSPLWLLRMLLLVVFAVGWSRAPLVAPDQDVACPKLKCPKAAPCRTFITLLGRALERISEGPGVPQVSAAEVWPQPRPQHPFVPVVPQNVTPAVCLPLGAWIEEAPREKHSRLVAPGSNNSNSTSDFLPHAQLQIQEVHSTDVWTLTPRGLFAAAVATTVSIITAFL